MSKPSRWFQVVPFVLSGMLFMSGIFSVFSPLPLLLLSFEKGRFFVFLAALTNCIVVFFASGQLSVALFVVMILSIAFALPEFLKRQFSLEWAGGLTLLVMLLCGTALMAGVAHQSHGSLIGVAKTQAELLLDYLLQNLSGSARSNWVGSLEPEEWKKSLLLELPSAVLIFALIMVWANLVSLLRFNPSGIRERLGLNPGSLKRWKAPEFLLWPTIVCGFFLLVDLGWISDVGLNLFKFLMAIYALQGVSVLSFFFDHWKVGGLIRSLGFMMAIFVMMPLTLSLGFFDLWFDFRGKFRQS